MPRVFSPGEDGPRPRAHDDERKHNRVQPGVITHVDPDGWMNVTVPGLNKDVTVRTPGFVSMRGFESAWFRFYPHAKSHATVAFGSDNTAELVGVPSLQGTPRQTKGHRHIYDAIDASGAKSGLSTFERLKQGEWDLRSSGGAYIRGSNQGALTLTGGSMTSVTLSKAREEARVEAPLFQVTSGACEVRLGTVKRTDPTFPLGPDKGVGFAPLSTPVEWSLKVGTPVLPVPYPPDTSADASPGTLYSEKIGVVRADGIAGFLVPGAPGSAMMTSTGFPLRVQKIAYTNVPTVVGLRVEMDIQGNVEATWPAVGVTPAVTIVPPSAEGPPSHGLVLNGGPNKALYASFAKIALTTVAPGFAPLPAGTPTLSTGLYVGGVNAGAEPFAKARTLYAILKAMASAVAVITPLLPDGATASTTMHAAIDSLAPSLGSLYIGGA